MPIHGNLVRYYDSEIYNEENLVRGVIITEHCDGGLLSDVVTQTYPQTFSEKMLLAILRDVACALFVLHTEDPPISYRNVNVRDFINRLDLLAQLHLRPCEWSLQTGSRALYDFQYDRICVSSSERQTPHTMEESRIVEQQLELVADPAYFPPEFCDLSLSFPSLTRRTSNSKHRKISEKVDVWELGILMYYLAFFSTPFESVDGKIDTRSLIAGHFTFPANEAKKYSAEFLEIIRRLLTADVNK